MQVLITNSTERFLFRAVVLFCPENRKLREIILLSPSGGKVCRSIQVFVLFFLKEVVLSCNSKTSPAHVVLISWLC